MGRTARRRSKWANHTSECDVEWCYCYGPNNRERMCPACIEAEFECGCGEEEEEDDEYATSWPVVDTNTVISFPIGKAVSNVEEVDLPVSGQRCRTPGCKGYVTGGVCEKCRLWQPHMIAQPQRPKDKRKPALLEYVEHLERYTREIKDRHDMLLVLNSDANQAIAELEEEAATEREDYKTLQNKLNEAQDNAVAAFREKKAAEKEQVKLRRVYEDECAARAMDVKAHAAELDKYRTTVAQTGDPFMDGIAWRFANLDLKDDPNE